MKLDVFRHPMFGDLPVIVVDGVEWFGATEAATALTFANPHKAIDNHVDEDDCTVHTVTDSLGRKQNKKFVNESGLYSLIFGAAKQGNNPQIKERAKNFKQWVTSDILPSVRKHGTYMTPDTIEKVLYNPDFIVGLAQRLKDEQSARIAAEKKIEDDRPKVLFAESLEVSKDSILIADLAKLLKQNGIDMGERRLFEWMRNEGYLIKSGSEYNMPSQRSMDLKIMEIRMGHRGSSDGTVKITRTPKITGKGQAYFINKFKNMSA